MTEPIHAYKRSPKAIICDWLNVYSGGDKANEFSEEADMLIRWLHDEGHWITSQMGDPANLPGMLEIGKRLIALERVREMATHYRTCKSEQAGRQDPKCLHVVWNGGPQDRSCVAQLFDALDEKP